MSDQPLVAKSAYGANPLALVGSVDFTWHIVNAEKLSDFGEHSCVHASAHQKRNNHIDHSEPFSNDLMASSIQSSLVN